MSAGWAVDRLAGTAHDLHARPFDPEGAPRVTILDVSGAALVLGSTQREDSVDADALAAAGIALARRRSGGGAVLLVPGDSLWIDADIRRDDQRWDDDVGRAFHWLGRAWAVALAGLGFRAEVHTGRLRESRWSRTVCFGGLGPGEVTVDGRKLVGISQRRVRAGARFQCVLHRRWEPAPLVDLLALPADERRQAAADLATAGTGLDVAFDELTAALVGHLEA